MSKEIDYAIKEVFKKHFPHWKMQDRGIRVEQFTQENAEDVTDIHNLPSAKSLWSLVISDAEGFALSLVKLAELKAELKASHIHITLADAYPDSLELFIGFDDWFISFDD